MRCLRTFPPTQQSSRSLQAVTPPPSLRQQVRAVSTLKILQTNRIRSVKVRSRSKLKSNISGDFLNFEKTSISRLQYKILNRIYRRYSWTPAFNIIINYSYDIKSKLTLSSRFVIMIVSFISIVFVDVNIIEPTNNTLLRQLNELFNRLLVIFTITIIPMNTRYF